MNDLYLVFTLIGFCVVIGVVGGGIMVLWGKLIARFNPEGIFLQPEKNEGEFTPFKSFSHSGLSVFQEVRKERMEFLSACMKHYGATSGERYQEFYRPYKALKDCEKYLVCEPYQRRQKELIRKYTPLVIDYLNECYLLLRRQTEFVCSSPELKKYEPIFFN